MFRCHVTNGTPTTGDEAAAVAWLTADEIADRMDQAYAVRMLDALNEGPPAIRSHDGVTLTQDDRAGTTTESAPGIAESVTAIRQS